MRDVPLKMNKQSTRNLAWIVYYTPWSYDVVFIYRPYM